MKALLIKLRDYIIEEQRDNGTMYMCGMCSSVGAMEIKKMITFHQAKMLLDYLQDHSPWRYFMKKTINELWWTEYELPPRINWLNKQIESCVR